MDIIDDDDPILGVEGKQILVKHFAYERNLNIVKEKKSKAPKPFQCEVCGFVFKNNYDIDFIECHHNIFLSRSIERATTLEDLSLVCSNCHRMLHKPVGGEFLSIPEWKNRIEL